MRAAARECALEQQTRAFAFAVAAHVVEPIAAKNFLRRSAQQLGAARVHFAHATLGIELQQDRIVKLEICVGAIPLAIEIGHCLVFRRDIANDAHETRGIAVRHVSKREPRGKDAAVLALRRDVQYSGIRPGRRRGCRDLVRA